MSDPKTEGLATETDHEQPSAWSPQRRVVLRSGAVATMGVMLGLLLSAGADSAAAALPNAFSTFKNSFSLSTGANQVVQVARLRVPRGPYVVVAKLYTGPPFSGLNEHVRCDIVAGNDFDRVEVNHDATTAFVSLSLNVVHRFPRRGTIRLNCGHSFTSGRTNLAFIKITALRVATLSNAPAP